MLFVSSQCSGLGGRGVGHLGLWVKSYVLHVHAFTVVVCLKIKNETTK